ncbi:MAG: hypothetical protein LBU32_33120 [Clostridiales bacterium]|nr:hypothetical protein [Clostridiales bacterium]
MKLDGRGSGAVDAAVGEIVGGFGEAGLGSGGPRYSVSRRNNIHMASIAFDIAIIIPYTDVQSNA